MKILRVFGAVVGIHVFAFLFLVANPGCSSTSKPAPTPADTAAKNEPSPTVSMPKTASGSGTASADASPLTPAPLSNDSPATVSFNSAGTRSSPTRPGSAAAASLEVQPVADVTPAKPYTVAAGDSLSAVAKKNKLTTAELAAANNLKPSAILRQGQKLIIPSKTTATLPPISATAATTAPHESAAAAMVGKSGSDVIKHTVKAGETLGAIAKKYGVKSGDIAVANNITDPKLIRLGQELIIPPAKPAAATKAAAKPAPSATPPAHNASPSAATPAPKPADGKPLFNVPPPGQDLDAGLKPAPANDVPVIKVEEAPASAPKKP